MKTFVRLEDDKVYRKVSAGGGLTYAISRGYAVRFVSAAVGKEVLPIDTATARALCKVDVIIDCEGMSRWDRGTLRWPEHPIRMRHDSYRYLLCGNTAVIGGKGHDDSVIYAEHVSERKGVLIVPWKDILFSLEEIEDDV